MWLQLTDIFGTGFLTMNGDEPQGRWLQTINELTDQQIIRGLKSLDDDDDERPPSRKRFRRACLHLHQMDVPKLPAPEYTLRDAQTDAIRAGVPRDLIAGKSMQELHDLELKARHGGFRGMEQ